MAPECATVQLLIALVGATTAGGLQSVQPCQKDSARFVGCTQQGLYTHFIVGVTRFYFTRCRMVQLIEQATPCYQPPLHDIMICRSECHPARLGLRHPAGSGAEQLCTHV
jgi:hypothetical protein